MEALEKAFFYMLMATPEEEDLANAVAASLSDASWDDIVAIFSNPSSTPDPLRNVLKSCQKDTAQNFHFINSVNKVLLNYTLAKRFTRDFPSVY